MKKTNYGKRIPAMLGAAVIAGSVLNALPVLHADAADTKILILGDSISAGYGLKNGENGYYDYLADVTGGTVTNLAVSGDATENLIEKLDTDAYRNAVTDANLICISIGGNDLLRPAQAYVESMRKDGESLLDTVIRVAKEGDPQTLIIGMTRALTPARTAAKTNFPLIESKIRALNPNAKIVMQTIYNPFEVSPEYLAQKNYSADTLNNYQKLTTYINNTVNSINKVIRELKSISYADIYEDFNGSGWLYDRVYEKDIHPNPTGHALIAASVLKAADITTGKSARMAETVDSLIIETYNQIPENDLALMQTYFGAYTPLRGDVNGDGAVKSTDAQELLLVYLSTLIDEPLESLISNKQKIAGDIDQDHEITAKDAQYILSYFLMNDVLDDETSWDDILNP